MSELVVDVCQVDTIRPHPNADRLDIAVIRGWQCVVPKGQYAAGQAVVYFPPDTMLPTAITDGFGVTKYCQAQPGGLQRIRRAWLRGEPSFGLIVTPSPAQAAWVPGQHVADEFGAKKYEPPTLGMAGDIAGSDPLGFDRFTEIENLRNYPRILTDGEEVIATEKIHGTCVRIGAVRGQIVAGSKNHARKRPENEADMVRNFYWFPYCLPAVRIWLDGKAGNPEDIWVMYGETYGRVQSLRYGLTGLAFRCFAISHNGKYLDYDQRRVVCDAAGIQCVPEIYRGPYSLAKMIELADGKSVVSVVDQIREGVVIQPAVERHDPAIGRVILKCVGTEYLMGKSSDSDTTDS